MSKAVGVSPKTHLFWQRPPLPSWSVGRSLRLSLSRSFEFAYLGGLLACFAHAAVKYIYNMPFEFLSIERKELYYMRRPTFNKIVAPADKIIFHLYT